MIHVTSDSVRENPFSHTNVEVLNLGVNDTLDVVRVVHFQEEHHLLQQVLNLSFSGDLLGNDRDKVATCYVRIPVSVLDT